MKRILLLFAVVAMVFGAVAAASAKEKAKSGDKTTIVFTVEPAMHCQNCENKIKKNLRFEKGVSNIATSVEKNTVTVTFDPAKTDAEKITKALGKIGYKAHKADCPDCSGKKECTGDGKCGDGCGNKR